MKPYHAACRRWREGLRLHKYRQALSRRPKTLPQDRRQISAVGPKPLVEEAGSNQNLRRRPVEGDLGAVAQIERGRPRFIRSPRTLDTRTTDTFIRSIRNSVGQSAKRSRWRSKPNPTIFAGPWKMRLQEHPAPTLKDVSRRLGYSSSTVLRAHEPELCDQLAARHRAHVMERRTDLERTAMAALGETPVPSVARSLQAPWHYGMVHE